MIRAELHRRSEGVSRRALVALVMAVAAGGDGAGATPVAAAAPSFPPAFQFDWGRTGCSRLQRPQVAIGATGMRIGATSFALLALDRLARNRVRVKLGARGLRRALVQTLSVDREGTRLSREIGGQVTFLYRCEA